MARLPTGAVRVLVSAAVSIARSWYAPLLRPCASPIRCS